MNYKKKSYSNIKGIETFRFYSIGVTQPGRDFNFNVKEYADTYKIINTIWNVYVYANEKYNLAKFNPENVELDENSLSKLDKWIISRTHSTIKKVTELADKYELPWIPGELRDFIVNDISRWYITLNREKLDIYSEDPNKFQIMFVLYQTLFNVLLMLAPINPMMSEELYLKMFKSYSKSLNFEEKESLHLQNWPKFDENKINIKLENQMHFTRDLIEIIRSLKEKNKIRLRWPNKKIIIEPKEGMPKIIFSEIIKKVGNVKELEIREPIEVNEELIKAETKFCNIYLDISLNDDLLAERVVNDLIRNIQFTRKKNGFKVGEKIIMEIGTNTEYLKHFVEKYHDIISDKVSAENLDILSENLSEDKNLVHHRLNICPNKKCSASLKDNIITKLKKKIDMTCPYCKIELKENKMKHISFNFAKNRD